MFDFQKLRNDSPILDFHTMDRDGICFCLQTATRNRSVSVVLRYQSDIAILSTQMTLFRTYAILIWCKGTPHIISSLTYVLCRTSLPLTAAKLSGSPYENLTTLIEMLSPCGAGNLGELVSSRLSSSSHGAIREWCVWRCLLRRPELVSTQVPLFHDVLANIRRFKFWCEG